MADSCVIDGVGPLPIVRPTNRAELGDFIRSAPSGDGLYPFGGGTKLGLGNPPSQQGVAVDMRGLDRLIDYPARDMTVTVEAGMTVAALQQELGKENLQLPIDVAGSEKATVGGIVAANVSGPRRFGYGTLRDYVIGISAMNDEGREFKAGGRVVKNVAGYDVCKLLVGSLGTLGIITQVTFKLRPLPDESALVTIPCPAEKIEAALDALHVSRTRPVLLEVLNPSGAGDVCAQANLSAPTGEWLIVVGYDGNRDKVEWQVKELTGEQAGLNSLQVLRAEVGEAFLRALTEFGALPEGCVVFKANMLPSATASFCLQANEIAPAALLAHAGSGIVIGRYGNGLTKEQTAAILGEWRAQAARGQGHVVVESCPAEWKNTISVWGPIGGDAWLMREIKEKFDPRCIFNSGRFFHGI